MAHFNIINFSVIWCFIIILIFSIQISHNTVSTATIIGQIKRTVSSEDNIDNVESAPERLNINYDEYPVSDYNYIIYMLSTLFFYVFIFMMKRLLFLKELIILYNNVF